MSRSPITAVYRASPVPEITPSPSPARTLTGSHPHRLAADQPASRRSSARLRYLPSGLSFSLPRSTTSRLLARHGAD